LKASGFLESGPSKAMGCFTSGKYSAMTISSADAGLKSDGPPYPPRPGRGKSVPRHSLTRSSLARADGSGKMTSEHTIRRRFMKHSSLLALCLLLPLLAHAQVAKPAPPAGPPAVTNAAPARLDITVHKGLSKKKTSTTSTQESYQFTVRVKNEEPSRKFENLSAELYVLSEDRADATMFNLIHRAEDSFALPVRGEHEFQSGLFYVKYTAQSGSELAGYIVVITDDTDRVVAVKSTRTLFEANLDKLRTTTVSTSKRKAFRLEKDSKDPPEEPK
jgi:hypothetical protein